MPTPMITEQWPRFVLPVIRKEWYQKMTAVISPVSPLFGTDVSTSAAEYSQGIGDMGLIPEYNSSVAEANGSSIQYGSFNPLYEKTFTHKEYAKGITIERKLWDDDQQGNIRRRAQALGNSTGSTIATHQSSVFNNAFSTSYLGADAVALCSATHPTSPSNSTSVVNRGTTALSYAAIVATQLAGFSMLADDGTPMPMQYDTLVIPGALKNTAKEILGSAYVPYQADLTASGLSGESLRVLVDPYLTDTNNWFMVDSAQSQMHLLWFWRVRPEIALDPSSDYNLVAKYRTYMRYSFGWDDFRFIFGHEVA